MSYTALIDGLCKAGQIEKACQIYARKRATIKTSDMDIYFRMTTAVKNQMLLRMGLWWMVYVEQTRWHSQGWKYAQEVFAKMSERGYSPNLHTYGSLIDVLFKDKRLDLFLKVLYKMLENSCVPNLVIYTEMIDSLCKVGKTDEAYKLLLKMQEKGCNLNVVTYTAMIDGFGKLGKIEMCLELLRDMCSKDFLKKRIKHIGQNISQDIVKVVEGFSREFINSIGLLNELAENESVPMLPVYRVLIDNFVEADRLEAALKLLEEVPVFKF
ncbi:hypothetical protein K1719_018472 [Acacia pycnantha]|nr:hypothetical protein K1719_018472 [Acacia pycnantha]